MAWAGGRRCGAWRHRSTAAPRRPSATGAPPPSPPATWFIDASASVRRVHLTRATALAAVPPLHQVDLLRLACSHPRAVKRGSRSPLHHAPPAHPAACALKRVLRRSPRRAPPMPPPRRREVSLRRCCCTCRRPSPHTPPARRAARSAPSPKTRNTRTRTRRRGSQGTAHRLPVSSANSRTAAASSLPSLACWPRLAEISAQIGRDWPARRAPPRMDVPFGKSRQLSATLGCLSAPLGASRRLSAQLAMSRSTRSFSAGAGSVPFLADSAGGK